MFEKLQLLDETPGRGQGAVATCFQPAPVSLSEEHQVSRVRVPRYSLQELG